MVELLSKGSDAQVLLFHLNADLFHMHCHPPLQFSFFLGAFTKVVRSAVVIITLHHTYTVRNTQFCNNNTSYFKQGSLDKLLIK